MGLKSISESPKKEIRDNSKVEYDFTKLLSDIPQINKEINDNLGKMEAKRLFTPKYEESKLNNGKKLVLKK